MLEIFSRNRFFNSLLLLPYTVLVRIWGVFSDTPVEIHEKGLLTEWLLGGTDKHSVLAIAGSILLVYLHALMINRIVIHNRLTNELTLFPGLFYILLVSFFPSFNGLSSPLIANTFVLIALGHLYATQKKGQSANRIFSTGFWLSTAFLFYFGYFPLLLCGIIGLSMLRTVKSREWLQYLIGYATPLAIVGMLDFVLHDNMHAAAGHFGQYGFLDFGIKWNLRTYGQVTLFGLALLLSFFNYGTFTFKKNIHVQKKINFLFWLLFFMMGAILVQSNVSYEEWVTISLPLSLFVAMMFIRSKQLLLLEILHFALLLAVIGLQVSVLM